MIPVLNYILEANFVLLLALAFYLLFLRRETHFRQIRIYLLVSVFASLVFPLIDLQFNANVPALSLSNAIPSYWLPEIVVGSERIGSADEMSLGAWQFAATIYIVGVALSSVLIGHQLFQLYKVVRNSTTYRLKDLRIAESEESKPTFSFFNFILIGKANDLTQEEKDQIIRHESVHARQWHSFDILLVNALKVLFWFNPFINTYKKIFIQLHEFEADARAVENADVNKYCTLLARIALQSANFNLVNHFNNSLTVKRIEMMRTIKSNIKRWKIVAIATALPIAFFFVACQDQMTEQLTEIAKNSSHALIVPEYIQERFEQLKTENPDKQYVLIELNEAASEKLKALEEQYGLPNSMHVYRTENKAGNVSPEVVSLESAADLPASEVKASGGQTFAIIVFDENVSRISETAAAQEDQVYTVVQQLPEFPGGYDALMVFIRENLRYPTEARQQGVEGTVYGSFIVEKDGAVSDVKIVRGISADCDLEVQRLLSMSPKWIPGKQNGKAVRVRFVLPIKFALQAGESK